MCDVTAFVYSLSLVCLEILSRFGKTRVGDEACDLMKMKNSCPGCEGIPAEKWRKV